MYQGRLQPVSFVVLTLLTITYNSLRDAFIFFVNLLPRPYANALDIFLFSETTTAPSLPPTDLPKPTSVNVKLQLKLAIPAFISRRGSQLYVINAQPIRHRRMDTNE